MDITWQHHPVTKQARAMQNRQQPCVIWFTGLSGSGKSTLAGALEESLFLRGHHSYLLDGDNIRHGLSCDLGFTRQDRIENIRRIGEVSKLFVDAGLIVITAFISPFRSDREIAKSIFQTGEFIDIFLDTPLSVCEERDPKGLYKKARAGEIRHFTGIDSPYEAPEHPALRIDTTATSVTACTETIVAYLLSRHYLLPLPPTGT